MDEHEKHTIKTPILLTLASFIIVVAGMKAASSLIVPFFLAIFIAVLCTPPLYWLQSKGLPKVLALAIILVTILAVGLLLGVLVGTSLNSFLKSLPNYQERLSNSTAPVIGWLQEKGIDLSKEGIGGTFSPERVMRLAANLLSATEQCPHQCLPDPPDGCIHPYGGC